MPMHFNYAATLLSIAAIGAVSLHACSSDDNVDTRTSTAGSTGTGPADTVTSGTTSSATGSVVGATTTTGSGTSTGAGGDGATSGSAGSTGAATTGSAGFGGSAGAGSGGSGGGGGAGGRGSGGRGGSGGRAGSGGAGGGAGATGSRDAGVDAGSCGAGADPLRTGTARVDAYDCILIQLAQQYGHPDPMMVKSQVQQESSFNVLATSPDSPCGIKSGWTDAESKSFGLVQVTPACGEATPALLPNGHPNLTTDMASALWTTSVYNPTLNLGEGFKTITGMLKSLQQKYAGCTNAQYVLMSAGAFNSGTGAVLGCGMFNARAQMYADAVVGHYHQFAKSAGWPDPY